MSAVGTSGQFELDPPLSTTMLPSPVTSWQLISLPARLGAQSGKMTFNRAACGAQSPIVPMLDAPPKTLLHSSLPYCAEVAVLLPLVETVLLPVDVAVWLPVLLALDEPLRLAELVPVLLTEEVCVVLGTGDVAVLLADELAELLIEMVADEVAVVLTVL